MFFHQRFIPGLAIVSIAAAVSAPSRTSLNIAPAGFRLPDGDEVSARDHLEVATDE